MKHAIQTQFGRPIEAVLTKDVILATDKWETLAALTDAAEHFGLSHRTLGVLKALMTFLPGRIINPVAGGAIVFPSNRTLSHRLNGMPDSTLRRHLAHLVKLGIVTRHDSPNRKRYARRTGQGIGIAFGFDLSPLARQNQMLMDTATSARDTRDAIKVMRDTIAVQRLQLLEKSGVTAITETTRIALRRKADLATLSNIHDTLTAEIEAISSPEMSSPDSQNERHIEYVINNNSDSEETTEDPVQKKQMDPTLNSPSIAENATDPNLGLVLTTCHEFKSYFPTPVRHWHDLIGIAERLTQMIGIDAPVFKAAIKEMGASRAATVVLCILENLTSIANPGGYLRSLTQQAQKGRFTERTMLDAIANRR